MLPYLPPSLSHPFAHTCSVNVTLGPREDRVLMTGLHTVCDIHCSTCESVLGWKYEVAFEESQKYKEGKFIIEKAKILKVRGICNAYEMCVPAENVFFLDFCQRSPDVCCFIVLQEGAW
jgi:hypothetical protein